MSEEISFRPYSPEKDEKAAIRIWKECGWLDMKKNSKARGPFRHWTDCGTADVAILRGTAECLVTTHRGTITLLESELPFRAISSVAAGRPLRRMGGSGELTARAVARAAADGDAVAALGIFDQGFYDKLGFGTFSYVRHISFDPLSLDVPPLKRPPVRLTKKDLESLHTNIQERMNHHGLVKFNDADFTGMILAENEEGFGLGFVDSEGKLSHHFWAIAKGESGPYHVLWMAYRDYSGLMELLSLIRNLGDQVNSFTMREPWGIQFQDLLKRPFRTQEITKGGEFENRIRALSYKQARILNLNLCLSALKLNAGTISFNLELDDPITGYLPEHAEWKGLNGSWTVDMGEDGSSAEPGHVQGLPLMKASVNAFTRLIFGVSTPAGLAFTDNLEASPELLADLSRTLCLPDPDMVQIF